MKVLILNESMYWIWSCFLIFKCNFIKNMKSFWFQLFKSIRNSQGSFFLSKATTIQRKKPDMNHNQVQFLKPKNTHPVWDSYQGPCRHVWIGWAIICRIILCPLIRSVGYLFWSYRCMIWYIFAVLSLRHSCPEQQKLVILNC